MCGIAGFADFTFDSDIGMLKNMIDTLNYRGPNDKGVEEFSFSTVKIGLAQSRLSIIDLSEGGHQPMHYINLSIVFNGEIYNYKEIKSELEKLGHHFKSQTDTEVILHAYSQWGSDAVHRFIGMFAIVILDRDKDLLLCYNDRAGVKPLYYYFKDGLFLFASELKAFHKHSKFIPVIDEKSVRMYFKNVHHGYIPAPYTIFENTWKLEQGSLLAINLKSKEFNIKKYWEIDTYYKLPKLNLSYSEAKEHLLGLFVSAFNYRMVSDVPAGIFLSGGYDSTAVTAILQKDRTEKLKTFTIGFEEGNNEAPYARKTAKYLGTDHTEYICTARDAQYIIPELPFFYDEPFADSSAIPTMLVSQLASKQVTVALSGDGGDEVFAGYDRYFQLDKRLKQLNLIPNVIKGITSPFLNLLSNLIPESRIEIKHKIKGIVKSINSDNFIQANELFRISNTLPDYYLKNLFVNKPEVLNSTSNSSYYGLSNELEIALISDYQKYLQNDILTKVDRATMSESIEGREPLLDHRIVEFAAQLPIDYKFDGRTGKRILKDIVHEYIPKELMNHPKAGFSLPIYSWLNGDLSFLIDEYLNEKAITESGLFNVSFVIQQVKLFKVNKLHYKPLIWKILMFQMWYSRWMK